MRGATVQIRCENCGAPKTVRVADRNRGWGRFCDKSCKAAYQEKRTGQMSSHLARQRSLTHKRHHDHGVADAHLFSNEE